MEVKSNQPIDAITIMPQPCCDNVVTPVTITDGAEFERLKRKISIPNVFDHFHAANFGKIGIRCIGEAFQIDGK
jgi:hypothetical protein